MATRSQSRTMVPKAFLMASQRPNGTSRAAGLLLGLRCTTGTNTQDVRHEILPSAHGCSCPTPCPTMP